MKRKVTQVSAANGAAVERGGVTQMPQIITAPTGAVDWVETQQELFNINEQLKVLSTRIGGYAPQVQQYLASAHFQLGCAWGQIAVSAQSALVQQQQTTGAEA